MGVNPDKAAEHRAQEPVPIGGVDWLPRKLTNKRLRTVRGFASEAREAQKEHGDDSEEAQEVGMKSSLAQIALMLKHPDPGTDDGPTIEFLDEHLDIRDVGGLLKQLVGSDDEGNSEPAAEPSTETEGTSA